MIRKCSGGCGKRSTVQPYKDARVVYFECSDCSSKKVVSFSLPRGKGNNNGTKVLIQSRNCVPRRG